MASDSYDEDFVEFDGEDYTRHDGPSAGARCTGKWLDPDVPKTEWTCIRIQDLGERSRICEMCEFQKIRYVHFMAHPEWPVQLLCGCDCSGWMSEDMEEAKRRDYKLKHGFKALRKMGEGVADLSKLEKLIEKLDRLSMSSFFHEGELAKERAQHIRNRVADIRAEEAKAAREAEELRAQLQAEETLRRVEEARVAKEKHEAWWRVEIQRQAAAAREKAQVVEAQRVAAIERFTQEMTTLNPSAWRTSANGNPVRRIKGFRTTVFLSKFNGGYTYILNYGEEKWSGGSYPSQDAAMLAVQKRILEMTL